jgi:hypothetical protein
MTSIDRQDAASALSDIDAVVRRVRQSRIYATSSLILMMWGVLVFIGYCASYWRLRETVPIWFAINLLGIAGSFVIGRFNNASQGARSFDLRVLAAIVLFVAFGLFCSVGLGHFNARQLGTFWPIYVMLFYSLAGLWFGRAFVVIGLSVTALTLIGYFFLGSTFDLWMAFVDGGGLILGGLWMRRS